jgi:hypothetical protein
MLWTARLGGAGVAAALLIAPASAAAECRATAPTPVPQPAPAQFAAAGMGGLPVAPDARRVDLVAPAFSRPTEVTNPLFPISNLHSVVLNGKVAGKPFRTETTLLPKTRIVEWTDGQCVRTLVSQYTAYLGGRLDEVALDYYAQADDGSVWYFGEDVFNYVNGLVADMADAWLSGKDGPAAMIMPGNPQLGAAFRAENIPGRVFEEVTVKALGRTVRGPRGSVDGAMVAHELHSDGHTSDKLFAPGYGEFRTAGGGELEALAIAVPTDAAAGPPPPSLERLIRAATAAYDAGKAKRRRAAARDAQRAWASLRTTGVPLRLGPPMRHALRRLAGTPTRQAALDVTQAALDIALRHLPTTDVDRARFELWTRQVQLDAAARRRAAVNGDVFTLEWIRERFVHSLDDAARTRLNARLLALRETVGDGDLRAVSRAAARLRAVTPR